MPLIVVINYSETDAERYGGKAGTLRDLEKKGLIVTSDASPVARWLARNPADPNVLIASHRAGQTTLCVGDTRLPEVEESWRKNLVAEAKQKTGDDYQALRKNLEAGRVAITAKCLRHRLPKKGEFRPDASRIFQCLVDVGAANVSPNKEGLDDALKALRDEFGNNDVGLRVDQRRRVLSAWQRVVSDLCVLELELSALSTVRDKRGDDEAMKYLGELVSDATYEGTHTLRQRLTGELRKLKQDGDLTDAPDVARIAALVDALDGVRAHPDAITRSDLDTVLSQKAAYLDAVRDTSAAFQRAIANIDHPAPDPAHEPAPRA